MDFPMNVWLICMCFINVLFKVIYILNFTDAVQSKVTFISFFVSHRMVSCVPVDLKIYSQKHTTVTRQLTKS